VPRKRVTKKAKLTPKERRFVELFALHLCATKAAKLAGYSEKSAATTGWRLLRKANVAYCIERRLERMGDDNSVTVTSVLEKAQRNYELAVKQGDIAAANKATELLGRHRGMFGKNVTHNFADGVAERLARAEARLKGKE